MVKKKDIINFLEWLKEDSGCSPSTKLPMWAKFAIEEELEELNLHKETEASKN